MVMAWVLSLGGRDYNYARVKVLIIQVNIFR